MFRPGGAGRTWDQHFCSVKSADVLFCEVLPDDVVRRVLRIVLGQPLVEGMQLEVMLIGRRLGVLTTRNPEKLSQPAQADAGVGDALDIVIPESTQCRTQVLQQGAHTRGAASRP